MTHIDDLSYMKSLADEATDISAFLNKVQRVRSVHLTCYGPWEPGGDPNDFPDNSAKLFSTDSLQALPSISSQELASVIHEAIRKVLEARLQEIYSTMRDHGVETD